MNPPILNHFKREQSIENTEIGFFFLPSFLLPSSFQSIYFFIIFFFPVVALLYSNSTSFKYYYRRLIELLNSTTFFFSFINLNYCHTTTVYLFKQPPLLLVVGIIATHGRSFTALFLYT